MLKALALALWLVAAMGCVNTYDPEEHGRYSLDTRAEETGRRTSPDAGLRVVGRRKGATADVPEVDRFAEARQAVIIPDTPAGRQLSWLMVVFNGRDTRALQSHFSEAFLRKTPEARLRAAIVQWKRDEFADGPVEAHAVEDSTMSRVSVVVRGRVTDRYSRVRVSTDKFGKIGELTLTPLRDYRPGELSDWAKVDTRLATQNGVAALAAYELTEGSPRPVHLYKADQVVAIGGLAGLYIAGTLAEQVAAGKAAWDEKMQIVEELKSVLGGRMQLEVEEHEFPLAQFLWLLMTTGDTTAFDHLLARADRMQVEGYMSRFNSAPARNKPFLATMEYFRIKLGPDRNLTAKYATATENERRMMLSPGGPVDSSVPSLNAAAHWKLPFELERVGWFASAEDLSRVMADLVKASRGKGMEPLANILRMNDALEPGSTQWKSAGFKGWVGPGLQGMVWLLERGDGRQFSLVMVANNPKGPVSQTELTEIAAAAISLLGEPETK